MAIALFTDFGHADPYVGQVKAALAREAPGESIIDLFNDAPGFNVAAASHLLAALVPTMPQGTIFVAVVDPGVGGPRQPVIVRAGGYCLVGPDNGLLSIFAGRAAHVEVSRITWVPTELSASFHGRDLFGPVAARIATGTLPADHLRPFSALKVKLGVEDLPQVIHVDHYGNAMTGIRASTVPRKSRMCIGGHARGHAGEHALPRARVFSEVPKGEAFWYENSLGLVEIAANCASAAARFGLEIGTSVRPTHRPYPLAGRRERSRRRVSPGSR